METMKCTNCGSKIKLVDSGWKVSYVVCEKCETTYRFRSVGVSVKISRKIDRLINKLEGLIRKIGGLK